MSRKRKNTRLTNILTCYVMIYLYIKLDGRQCGALGLWETLYKGHTSWPKCVTSKADNFIKFLLLVFKCLHCSLSVLSIYQ